MADRAKLGGRFGYFLFFFCLGRGKGVRGARSGGVGFFLKIPGEGVGAPGGGGGFQEGCLERIGEFGGGGG